MSARVTLALLVYGVNATRPGHTLDDALARGERPAAPAIALPRLEGNATASLADDRGRVVVLNHAGAGRSSAGDSGGLRAGRELPEDHVADVENAVMCLVCGVPLALADAPQAQRERVFISRMVRQCRSKRQIESALVERYGPRVLALPKPSACRLAAYLVPVLAATAVLAAPRSRPSARDAAGARHVATHWQTVGRSMRCRQQGSTPSPSATAAEALAGMSASTSSEGSERRP